MSTHDEWKATWDWADSIWDDDEPYSLNRFFRGIASVIAEREEWEELGSSDVWHASYHCVQSAKKHGVTTGAELRKYVMDYQQVGEWELR